jgi:hypothetical protein
VQRGVSTGLALLSGSSKPWSKMNEEGVNCSRGLCPPARSGDEPPKLRGRHDLTSSWRRRHQHIMCCCFGRPWPLPREAEAVLLMVKARRAEVDLEAGGDARGASVRSRRRRRHERISCYPAAEGRGC